MEDNRSGMSLSDEEKQHVMALAEGKTQPATGMERHFVNVLNGKGTTCSPEEKQWMEFVRHQQKTIERIPNPGSAKRETNKQNIITEKKRAEITEFEIIANEYKVNAFYHCAYKRFEKPGNPDYLNHLKNTYNNLPNRELQSAVKELRCVLQGDLPQILQSTKLNKMVTCVVPRAKKESHYSRNQQLFKSTVQDVVAEIDGLADGTRYIQRHTNTKTTHLPSNTPNYNNDGREPYSGITKETCEISTDVADKDILLIDDIYTPNVNIDEDAIQALYDSGARTVIFYAVAKAGS